MKNKDIEKWEKTKEEKKKIEEYRTRKKRLVYRLIIFSGFIILTAYLMYNGFYIIGSILLLIAFLVYYYLKIISANPQHTLLPRTD